MDSHISVTAINIRFNVQSSPYMVMPVVASALINVYKFYEFRQGLSFKKIYDRHSIKCPLKERNEN